MCKCKSLSHFPLITRNSEGAQTESLQHIRKALHILTAFLQGPVLVEDCVPDKFEGNINISNIGLQ